MGFLTNDKLVIVGAAGMIGSNMAQTAAMLKLTPNICLYDIFEPGLLGVLAEMDHCAFPGVNITATIDPAVAFKDAKYIISSGGAPRKEGMTREDLLKGNCKIAAEFGENIEKYCPDVKFVVVIFNPADVTALTALIRSGLKPEKLTSLAALDSTRLQEALAKEFGVQPAPTLMVVTERLWQCSPHRSRSMASLSPRWVFPKIVSLRSSTTPSRVEATSSSSAAAARSRARPIAL